MQRSRSPGQQTALSSGPHIAKWLSSLSPAHMNGVGAPPAPPHLGPPDGKPAGPLAAGVLARALSASWHTMALPWHLFQRWLSLCAALLIHFFTYLGAPPQGYIAQAKVRELNSIIEHMHTREDLYRKTIRELQEELEHKDHDKRRALRRLKNAKAELELLQQQVAGLHEEYHKSLAGGGGGRGSGAAAGSSAASPGSGSEAEARLNRTALHVTMALLLALVWWFYQQECHAIQRKLVFSILFPVLWSYVTTLLTRRPAAHPVLLHSVAWCLIGFVGAYKFSQVT